MVSFSCIATVLVLLPLSLNGVNANNPTCTSLAVQQSSGAVQSTVEILVTGEVRGSAFPVSKSSGSRCSVQEWQSDPCSCRGGAGKRKAILANAANAKAVVIDTGAYFYGNGLFFPTFKGDASASLFAASNYDAFGLTYRDFSAGVSADDPTGGLLLASYLTKLRTLDSSLPPAVVTNLNLTGDQHLTSNLVRAYASVDLPGNRELVLLNLLDPTHLAAVTPHYAAHILSYEKALQVAMWELLRRPRGKPDVVILVISGVPLTADDLGQQPVHAAEVAYVERLVAKTIGLNAVFLSSMKSFEGAPRIMRNWANDDVILLPVNRKEGGLSIDNVTLAMDNDGKLQLGTVCSIPLDCTSEDPATKEQLINFDATVQTKMSAVQGTLLQAVDGAEVRAGSCTEFLSKESACGCRVAECGAGRLAADAMQWFAGTDVAFVNAGSIRSSLPKGAVTTGDVLQMLPFNNEVVRIKNVPGSTIRAALQHGISKLHNKTEASEDGLFLQSSATLRFEWFFEGTSPKLGKVYIGTPAIDGQGTPPLHFDTWVWSPAWGERLVNFTLLSDDSFYSVATSSYIAGGGDNYNFSSSSLNKERLGSPVSDSLIDFVSSVGFKFPYSSDKRVIQKKTRVQLQVGILCGGLESGKREECDIQRFMMDSINDKSDGFLDDILEDAILVYSTENAGCSKSMSQGAFQEIKKKLPEMSAVIGPQCSADVQDLTNTAYRAATVGSARTVLFSPSSTAVSLRDRGKYPNLMRMTTPDSVLSVATVTLMKHFSWQRIATLHDETAWGASAIVALREVLTSMIPTHTIVNSGEGEGSFPLARLSAVDFPVVLDRLSASGARIIFIALNPPAALALSEAVFTTRKLFGKGFAWLTAWPSYDSFRREAASSAHAAEAVSANAVKGQQGILGFVQAADVLSVRYKEFNKLWQKVSTQAACIISLANATATYSYCDANGKEQDDLSVYGAFSADAVLTYAMAMDKMYRSENLNPDDLYKSALNLEPFNSISGDSMTFDSNGDREGFYQLRNLQVLFGDRRLRSSAPLRRATIELKATTATFVDVGLWSEAGGLSFERIVGGVNAGSYDGIIWPGGGTEAPLDHIPSSPTAEDAEFPVLVLVAIAAGITAFFLIIFVGYRWHMRGKIRSLESDLNQMKNDMLSVEAVVSPYDPLTDGSSSGQVSASTVQTFAPVVPQFRSLWYWQEDQSRLGAHNQNDIFQPGNFVKYAGSVCAEVEDAWGKWNDGSGPSKLKLNLTDRIASTGTETKAYAADSGYDFEIDFTAMTQKNFKSGFARSIMRHEVPIPGGGLPPAPIQMPGMPSTDSRRDGKKISKTMGKVASSGSSSGSLDKPADLAGEDFLVLHVGQLVQYSQRRPDGWAFGCIIYDEETSRPGIDVPGVSASSGWFPTSCTDLPSTGQLKKLQEQLGGEGAKALKIPDYWEQVKDPMGAELFRLRDDLEKQAVVNAFMATLQPNVKVISVDRVENMTLWQSYAVKKQTMTAGSAGPADQVERVWLFHGTTEDIVPKITQQGFNRSFCGRNATMYGKGVYFARDASYSSGKTYSAPDAKGIQRMFLCRVAVGSYCRGVKDAVTPDVKDPVKLLLYDTTVDNTKDPSIFVTYHDGQAYPEYLIHFKQP